MRGVQRGGTMTMRRLRILTWHVHGNYLWYLTAAKHDFFLPVAADGGDGYGGRGSTFPLGENVRDIPADEVRNRQFDCVIYQSREHYERDRYEILNAAQRRLPCLYVEHDPPLEHPTEQRHWFAEDHGMLVHVTPFNALMWNNGSATVRVIDHGVPCRPEVGYAGDIRRGIVVINNLGSRGRRVGPDLFLELRKHAPLDLVGMGSESLGGLGEVEPPKLAQFEARYRFFLNPIRYTSLNLAVCEAMMLGMPIVALATTEMATVVQNGVSGFIDTRLEGLVAAMRILLDDAAVSALHRRKRPALREAALRNRTIHQ